jgi:hypothetical protein
VPQVYSGAEAMTDVNDMPEYWAYHNAKARCSRQPGEQDYAEYA